MQLDEVLHDLEWSISDGAAFEQRLFDEFLALESANVHSIIQSEEQVNELSSSLDQSISSLASMDQWFAYYNSQLRLLRQNSQQIEFKNNRIQIQTQNQKLLLETVEALLVRSSIWMLRPCGVLTGLH